MRRILSATEYEKRLSNGSEGELQQAAHALAKTARSLMEQDGLHRAALLCAPKLTPLAKLTAERLCASGKSAVVYQLQKDELPELSDSLICDLLFDGPGNGSNGSLFVERQKWIEVVVGSGCTVVSVAIPAGVDPDTGRADHQAVRSQVTVAPGAYLSGLFLHDGLDYCGRIVPVGGESDTWEGLIRFEAEDAERLLPPRKRTAHKGDSGKTLLCVGSPKYVGAALLSARACLAAGCGILFVACPDVVRVALWQLPEAIGIPVGTDWDEGTCRGAIEAMDGIQVIGMGCGVGNGDVSCLLEAALRSKRPLVLDADGLNCLYGNTELIRDYQRDPDPSSRGDGAFDWPFCWGIVGGSRRNRRAIC